MGRGVAFYDRVSSSFVLARGFCDSYLAVLPRRRVRSSSVIKKQKGKYVVLSEKTGRSFGSYKTLAAAKKRLGQVEYFKHRGKK